MENKKITLDVDRVFKANKKDKLITALIITAFVVVVIALFSVLRGTTEIGMVSDPEYPNDIAYFSIDYFKLIFGGFVSMGNPKNISKDAINVCVNPMLLTAFCLAVVALILLVLVLVSHKTLLLDKKAFNIVAVIAILFFIAAGTLFIFKNAAVKNQLVITGKKIGDPIPEEYLDMLRFGMDVPTILFIGGQFVAGLSLIGVLIADNKMKY